VEDEAYDALRDHRQTVAREEGGARTNASQICQWIKNRTLREMVSRLPADADELAKIFGMGSTKVEHYGEGLLRALQPWRAQLSANYNAHSFQTMPVTPEDLTPAEHRAFVELREWKRATGRALGFNNPCVIAHNRTLCELTRHLPSGPAGLPDVWGLSAARIEAHGAGMLAALAPFRGPLAAAAAAAAAIAAAASAAACATTAVQAAGTATCAGLQLSGPSVVKEEKEEAE
jgi:superfamily II DNA helicase RecQ